MIFPQGSKKDHKLRAKRPEIGLGLNKGREVLEPPVKEQRGRNPSENTPLGDFLQECSVAKVLMPH